MIAEVRDGVEGIVADATSLRLGRQFDAVLMASHLVNDPDHGLVFTRTATAHVRRDGWVIGETYPPGWDAQAAIGQTSHLGDASVTLLRADLTGDLLDAEVRYGVDGLEWTQSFVARVLDEPALRDVLRTAGLAFAGWLGRPSWFLARPQ